MPRIILPTPCPCEIPLTAWTSMMTFVQTHSQASIDTTISASLDRNNSHAMYSQFSHYPAWRHRHLPDVATTAPDLRGRRPSHHRATTKTRRPFMLRGATLTVTTASVLLILRQWKWMAGGRRHPNACVTRVTIGNITPRTFLRSARHVSSHP